MIITKEYLDMVVDHRKKYEYYIQEMREEIFRVAEEYCELAGWSKKSIKCLLDKENSFGFWEDRDDLIFIEYYECGESSNFTFPTWYLYDSEWKEKVQAEWAEVKRKAKEKAEEEKKRWKEAYEAHDLKEYKRLKKKYEGGK